MITIATATSGIGGWLCWIPIELVLSRQSVTVGVPNWLGTYTTLDKGVRFWNWDTREFG